MIAKPLGNRFRLSPGRQEAIVGLVVCLCYVVCPVAVDRVVRPVVIPTVNAPISGIAVGKSPVAESDIGRAPEFINSNAAPPIPRIGGMSRPATAPDYCLPDLIQAHSMFAVAADGFSVGQVSFEEVFAVQAPARL